MVDVTTPTQSDRWSFTTSRVCSWASPDDGHHRRIISWFQEILEGLDPHHDICVRVLARADDHLAPSPGYVL